MLKALHLFRNATEVQVIQAGQTIFREGEPGDFMAVILEGQVDILVQGHLLETEQPGGMIGEMALIDFDLRSATAIARTTCKLVPIDRKRFTFLVQETPHFALQVMQVMADRLRRMNALAMRV